jgi:hypothetical protein
MYIILLYILIQNIFGPAKLLSNYADMRKNAYRCYFRLILNKIGTQYEILEKHCSSRVGRGIIILQAKWSQVHFQMMLLYSQLMQSFQLHYGSGLNLASKQK